MSPPPAIRLQDLSVHIAGRCLLTIPRLEVASGEFLGVLGPNGAGKTTLCRCLLGLPPHAHGTILLHGTPLARLSSAERRGLRRRMGYVPQLLPAAGEMPLTVREVVAMGRTARRGVFHRLDRADHTAIDAWLDRLGLGNLAIRRFTDLSGGEQRKTLIARALAQEPDLLVLDEPSANLDLGWRERLVACIGRLHRDLRLTILLVCHELEVLPPECRRVLLLVAGHAEAEGSPEEVFSAARVALLYGSPFEILHRHGRHAAIPGPGST